MRTLKIFEMPTLENARMGACLGCQRVRIVAPVPRVILRATAIRRCMCCWPATAVPGEMTRRHSRYPHSCAGATLQAQMNSELVYDLEREAMHDDASSSHHATTFRGGSLREVSARVERGGNCEVLCRPTDPPGKARCTQAVLADSAGAKLLSAHETTLVVARGNCEAKSVDVGTVGRAGRAQHTPPDIAEGGRAGMVRPSQRAWNRAE